MVVSPSHHEEKVMKVIDDVGSPARAMRHGSARTLSDFPLSVLALSAGLIQSFGTTWPTDERTPERCDFVADDHTVETPSHPVWCTVLTMAMTRPREPPLPRASRRRGSGSTVV